MITPSTRPRNGFVAVLDALGASTYSEKEVFRFIKARSTVMEALNAKAEVVIPEEIRKAFTTFTFNDTVAIVLPSQDQPGPNELRYFFILLRKFLVDSLTNGILFRGAVSIGSFYLNRQDNLVMGQAVTDAAAWYESADWMGIHATPHATLVMDQWIAEDDRNARDSYYIRYEVPMKAGKTIELMAANWPKVFYRLNDFVKLNENKRAKLLQLLNRHRVPLGTENKYFNTVAFFDSVVKRLELEKPHANRRSK